MGRNISWLLVAALASSVSGCKLPQPIDEDLVGKFEPDAIELGPPVCKRRESPNVTVDPTLPVCGATGSGGAGNGLCTAVAGTGSRGLGAGLTSANGSTALDRGHAYFEFTTIQPRPGVVGQYDNGGPPVNVGAVWITDDRGRYVKTLEYWGLSFFSVAKLGNYTKPFRDDCPQDVDVTSQATFHGHTTHKLTWSGRNFAGKIANDGDYILYLEVHIDEHEEKSHGTLRVQVHEGPHPVPLRGPSKPPHTGLSFSYTPE